MVRGYSGVLPAYSGVLWALGVLWAPVCRIVDRARHSNGLVGLHVGELKSEVQRLHEQFDHRECDVYGCGGHRTRGPLKLNGNLTVSATCRDRRRPICGNIVHIMRRRLLTDKSAMSVTATHAPLRREFLLALPVVGDLPQRTVRRATVPAVRCYLWRRLTESQQCGHTAGEYCCSLPYWSITHAAQPCTAKRMREATAASSVRQVRCPLVPLWLFLPSCGERTHARMNCWRRPTLYAVV